MCLPGCMSVHHEHVRWLCRSEEAVRSPGSGVIGGCEPVLVLGRDLGKSGKCTLTPSQPSSLHPAFWYRVLHRTGAPWLGEAVKPQGSVQRYLPGTCGFQTLINSLRLLFIFSFFKHEFWELSSYGLSNLPYPGEFLSDSLCGMLAMRQASRRGWESSEERDLAEHSSGTTGEEEELLLKGFLHKSVTQPVTKTYIRQGVK